MRESPRERERERDGGPEMLRAPEAVFEPVRSSTAFEETVERLGTAIKLGLLPAGSRLPAERELCARLGIARSTLRQALTALAQSGYVYAVRGRSGGTFVADPQPPAEAPSSEVLEQWREICDQRLAIELGVAVLAAERARPADLEGLDELIATLDDAAEDFPRYRQADVRLHVALAAATGSRRLLSATTEIEGQMTDLIACIPHPAEVLRSSNEQHRRLLAAVRERDSGRAAEAMSSHLRGTEHVLAGLMPGARAVGAGNRSGST